VEDYEKIKKAILRDGMSQRQAAKTFKHGRETIRKILEHGTPPIVSSEAEGGSIQSAPNDALPPSFLPVNLGFL